MRKCCFFDILFLYCFLQKRDVCIYTDIQRITKAQCRLAKLVKNLKRKDEYVKIPRGNNWLLRSFSRWLPKELLYLPG